MSEANEVIYALIGKFTEGIKVRKYSCQAGKAYFSPHQQ